MGRPSKFDRAAAVEVAMTEIWKNGMAASSAKALSEKLAITRSSFYNAFGNRDQLFGEVLALYFRQSPDRAFADLGPDDRVLEILHDTLKEVCRVRAADPDARGCMAVNCVAELVGTDPTLGPVMKGAINGSIKGLENLLMQAVRNGEIENPDDLRGTALALQNLLIGLNLMSKVVRSEKDLWAATRLTLQGLGLYQHSATT